MVWKPRWRQIESDWCLGVPVASAWATWLLSGPKVATDYASTADLAGRGVILRHPHGGRRRLRVNGSCYIIIIWDYCHIVDTVNLEIGSVSRLACCERGAVEPTSSGAARETNAMIYIQV